MRFLIVNKKYLNCFGKLRQKEAYLDVPKNKKEKDWDRY